MIPLVDMHCHLLAGLDDGPRSAEDALAMCRLAYAEGTRMACATAHQNERWDKVTPDAIREAVRRLADQLRDHALPLTVFPCAEVMAHPELDASWRNGQLLSVADRGRYLLVEMPHGPAVDLRSVAGRLAQAQVSLILAHPERHEELLEDPRPIEDLVGAGCLVQVSAKSLTDPGSRSQARELKSWFQRGLVHLLGSDGHSPHRRPPRLADAYREVVRWVGVSAADRIGSTNGLAVLQGLPVHIPSPGPRSRRWFSRFW
jgi:protein-tyrosine phosphatase